MRSANPHQGWPAKRGRRRQRGQALIYGLFLLMAGLAGTFFLFNVGQLTREKTKLVNTTDAVAYSAGVMHARALNFAAYTNRALVANEVAIAQMVSLASWGKYLEQHGESALGLGCTPDTYYLTTTPGWELMMKYVWVCIALGTASEYEVLKYVNEGIQMIGQLTMATAEASKKLLQGSQVVMMGTLPFARNAVMQEVADANYSGDGAVEVDLIPLRDTFYAFSDGPLMDYYTGDRRGRMRDFVKDVVRKDGFTPSRNWSDTAGLPEPSCLAGGFVRHNYVVREGG
ncbi:MAG TPA: pilus assembly protein TadG-related protein, partial [Burkholderiaceae bacterium]|nr:pilus assembly protein TadG-related protein [Burkholderiaceae bacterium]